MERKNSTRGMVKRFDRLLLTFLRLNLRREGNCGQWKF